MTKENVAIILAVHDYGSSNSLPGCKNDGELIRRILEKTGKFSPDNTLFIDADTSSANVKGSLSRFISGFKNREVGEVFYFYTGHGLFDGLDFYYLLSDYAPSRTQATTLANNELDEMLRSLRADLAVKVIDACYSAQQYVKSPNEFEKAIEATRTGYKHCYFMFSSEQTQASWQDGNLSYFTLEFAKAIQHHSADSIRYKDIIDFVSDSFAPNARQKPVFVAQANFTEEFSSVDESMRQMIANLLSGTAPTVPITDVRIESRSLTEQLKERIQKDAEAYGTLEDAEAMFDVIRAIIDEFQLPDPIEDLYTLRSTFMTEQYGVPKASVIGEWLQGNLGDLFAAVIYGKEYYQAQEMSYPRSGLTNAIASVYGTTSSVYQAPEFKTVTKERTVVSGFDSTEKMPFKSVHLVAEPKLQNLPWWKWYCAFIVSKTEIKCFVTDVRLKETNWQERQEQGKIQWQISTLPMKETDVVKKRLNRVLDQFGEAITMYLMEKYGLTEEDSNKSSTSSTE